MKKMVWTESTSESCEVEFEDFGNGPKNTLKRLIAWNSSTFDDPFFTLEGSSFLVMRVVKS